MNADIDLIAYCLGYSVMACGGVFLTCMIVWIAVRASIWAQGKAVESYGGWKVFREYRQWLADRDSQW